MFFKLFTPDIVAALKEAEAVKNKWIPLTTPPVPYTPFPSYPLIPLTGDGNTATPKYPYIGDPPGQGVTITCEAKGGAASVELLPRTATDVIPFDKTDACPKASRFDGGNLRVN